MSDPVLINIFILISLFLTAGYFLGRRKNRAIAASAINAIFEMLKPDRREITNIGGLVGYHLRMSFISGSVESAFGTITLLPRHSLLYLPVSLLFRRFDRFFITLNLRRFPTTGSAHIFEERFYSGHREGVGKQLKRSPLQIGSLRFLAFYSAEEDLAFLKKLLNDIEDPSKLKEISIRPERGTVEILIVPTAGDNETAGTVISSLIPPAERKVPPVKLEPE
jgi:hypothetical protein